MKIRPIIFVQSQDSISGYGIADFSKIKDIRNLSSSVSPPYLILGITPVSYGDFILKVDAVYNDGKEELTTTLESEIQNLGLFLSSDMLREGTIPEKLSQYLSLFEEGDVRGMALTSLRDTSGFIGDPTDTPEQMALDAFVIGVAGYMTSLKFLLEDRVYSNLPFPFTLPFHVVNESVLNANTFKYICHPSTAMTTHSQYSSTRVLMDQILRFCNEWSPLFDDGPELDMNTAIIDTVSGYCKLSVMEMSEFQRNMLGLRDEMSNIQNQLTSGKEEMKEEMNEMKSEIQSEVNYMTSGLEDKINKIFQEKLENFKEEIRDIFLEETRNALTTLKTQVSEYKELQNKEMKEKEWERRSKRKERRKHKTHDKY